MGRCTSTEAAEHTFGRGWRLTLPSTVVAARPARSVMLKGCWRYGGCRVCPAMWKLAGVVAIFGLLARDAAAMPQRRKATDSGPTARSRQRRGARPAKAVVRAPAAAAMRPAQVGTIRHLIAGNNGKFSIRDGKKSIGGLGYTRNGNVVSLVHTVVSPEYRGRGIARRLVAHAVAWARREGVKLVPACSFAVAEFAKNPQYADVLP